MSSLSHQEEEEMILVYKLGETAAKHQMTAGELFHSKSSLPVLTDKTRYFQQHNKTFYSHFCGNQT